MSVPKGYKRTEVGVIPEEWSLLRVGEVATTVASGRSHVENSHGEFPVYGSTGEIGRSSKPAYAGASVLIARVGANAGKMTVVDGRYGVTDNTIIVKINEKVDFSYFCRQIEVKDLNKMAFGSGQPLVTGTQIKSIAFAIPSTLPEQRAIAEALGDVDALLVALDAAIAKQRDLKQAAMQQLLTGQTRLPGFQGEWEVKRLGHLGQTFGGLTGKTKEDFGSGSANYITFMNVMENTKVDCGTFDKVRISLNEHQNTVQRGDLCFNGSSETAEELALCSVLTEEVGTVYLNSFCFGFRPNTDAKFNGLYLAYYFRGKQGRDLMQLLAQGSTRYNLSKSAFLQSTLCIPGIEEQDSIVSAISDMDAALTALESRRAKTAALKQAMMQELLTGRTRLLGTPSSSSARGGTRAELELGAPRKDP